MDQLPEKKQEVIIESRYDRGGRGRPPKIPLEPENEMVREIMNRREKTIETSDLRQRIEQEPDSLDVLDDLMLELAREVGGLEFDRSEQIRKKGAADPTYSSKRVTALKAIGDMFFKKRDQLLEENFDFSSRKFQKLFEFWFRKVRNAAKQVMAEEEVELFFEQLEQDFEDWEDEAMKHIKTHL